MEQQNNTMIRIEALTKTYAVPGGTVDALKGIDLGHHWYERSGKKHADPLHEPAGVPDERHNTD